MRAGGGFGVILYRKRRFVFQTQSLVRSVEQADMRDFCRCGQGFRQDAEAVVLAGYVNFAGLQVFDGVVCAAMPTWHFRGFCAEGKRQNLVAEANAEQGDAAFDDFLDNRRGIYASGGGIARAV